MSEDRPLPSPRTTDEPMAFTRDELTRGAWYTWFIFIALVFVGLTIILEASIADASLSTSSDQTMMFIGLILLSLVVTVFVAGPISLFVMVAGVLVAWPIGHLLRRTRAIALHISAYVALGLPVGAIGMWLISVILGGTSFFAVPTSIVVSAASVIAVPAGWWFTFRRALADDSYVLRRTRHTCSFNDADAAVEDAAFDHPSSTTATTW